MSAADKLRAVVQWCNGTPEDWLDRYSLEDLVRIYEATQLSGFTVPPQEWPRKSISAALRPPGYFADDNERRAAIDEPMLGGCWRRNDAD